MTVNEVTILVSAKDQTKAAFTSAEQGANRVNTAIKGIATAAAATALVGLGRDAFNEAEEAEKTAKLTESVIKSTGGAAQITTKQVGDLADSLSQVAAVDDELIQSGENLLLTFTNIKNAAGKGNDIFNQSAAAALDMTAAMNSGTITQDGLKSSTIQLGKALNDPIKGITALTRVGVTFTEEQKKAIEQHVKMGDTLGAQKIILAELKKEFGGAAAASATPAAKAQVAWKNLLETIGTKLLPVVEKLSKILIPLFNFIGDHATAFGILTTTILGVVAAVKIWTAVQAVLDAELWANPIGVIILAIIALVAVIVWLATKTQFFQTVWHAVWDFLKAVGHWFAHDFAGFFVKGYHMFMDGLNGLVRFWKNGWDGLVAFVTGLPGRISKAAHGMWDGVKDAFKSAVNWIIDKWNGLEFKIPSVSFLGHSTSGFTLGVPDIPRLQSGGQVTSTGLALVHQGETVVPAGTAPLPRSGGSVQHTVTFAGNTDSAMATAFMKMFQSGLVRIDSQYVN